MTTRYLWCITLYLLCHPQAWTQTLTNQLPPAVSLAAGAVSGGGASGTSTEDDLQSTPTAEVMTTPATGVPVRIVAREQGKRGDIWTLAGAVTIYYRTYVVHADTVTYDEASGEIEAKGHVRLEGGPDDEVIEATHGTLNLDAETGHFYQVTGSIGMRKPKRGTNAGFESNNPFLFTGREVFKDGPNRYRVVDGTMTSCQLPRPDWELLSKSIRVNDGEASAKNTRFELLRVPLFWLPYVTHPVSSEGRQSGFLIPTFGTSTTKGLILGEQFYWAINRSSDLTFGSEYYSNRGFAPRGEYRYRGAGRDFLTLQYHGLFDRGLEAKGGGAPTDQGGHDVIADGRRDFSPETRLIGDVEYLSSYVFRQAFEENFSIATNSEVKSQVFLQHEHRALAESLYFARYQSFQSDAKGDEIRILHLPSLQMEGVGRSIGGTRAIWGFTAAINTLTRSEPLFHARNVARVDLHPHVSLPLELGGWTLRPEIGARETFYSKSERLPNTLGGGISPTLRGTTLNRGDFEAGMELRPPTMERDFSSPWLTKWLGGDVRHTIEPALKYRYVNGISNFESVLRFDDTDIASNTNEVEYSLTQRLFLKHVREHPCRTEEAQTASGMCGGGTANWVSWQVAQKYFFDTNFGGAVVSNARNVLATTLDFSGTAFLYGPRSYSPVISRLRVRTSSETDVEWDADYDTKAGRLSSTNLFATYHRDNITVGVGQFQLNSLEGTATSAQNIAAAVTNFNQLRLLFTYGGPSRLGFSVGANSGYDFVQNGLQFGGVQTGYNWNCCGVSVEYRRYALGSVRNENQYLYSFTLAGIGTAGNLRRAVRIF